MNQKGEPFALLAKLQADPVFSKADKDIAESAAKAFEQLGLFFKYLKVCAGAAMFLIYWFMPQV